MLHEEHKICPISILMNLLSGQPTILPEVTYGLIKRAREFIGIINRLDELAQCWCGQQAIEQEELQSAQGRFQG